MDGLKIGDRVDAEVVRKGKVVDASVETGRKSRKAQRLKTQGIPLGRNERCPCGSGKKNKFCHNVKRWNRNADGKIQGWR